MSSFPVPTSVVLSPPSASYDKLENDKTLSKLPSLELCHVKDDI